jgi:hypothetical protein
MTASILDVRSYPKSRHAYPMSVLPLKSGHYFSASSKMTVNPAADYAPLTLGRRAIAISGWESRPVVQRTRVA